MIQYLKFREAPSVLVQQAMLYKEQLWRMKDGILTTHHLKELPVPLQMELIFDINVGHFHDSFLLGDTEESFLRHISLLMRHELYLAGQYVWNQGVVKNGMLFIKRGVLEMLSDEDDESPMIAFKEGTVLGEINLFYSIPSKVTVKAATYVELQNAITRYDQNDSRVIRTRYRPMKLFKNHLSGVSEEDPTFVDDSHMLYKAHFIMVLYVCVMCPHLATVALQSDWEKVLGTIVIAGLLLNIYIQLTTAIVQKNVRKETVREITEEKMASLGFYLDVVSVFPMYIFTDTLDPTGESIATQIAIMFPTLQESMRELFYFLSVNHVSVKIKARVKKFFCVQWYYNKAVSSDEIFKDMSSNIQQEILSLEMIETLLCCPLFQGYCKRMNNQGNVESSFGPGTNVGVVEMLYGLPKVIKDPEISQQASRYEEGKPLIGKNYAKTNKITVFRITGTFSYWETDIMQVNQAVVLLKFLPIAMTLVNFATAFIFMNSCRPCILPNTSYAMEKTRDLADFLYRENVDFVLTMKTLKYFEYVWKRTHGSDPQVDVLSSYNEMITCMGPGGMFGNFTGQPVSISGVAIYASRNLDLLVLPSQMFFNLVKYYPKIHEPLKKAFEMSKDYILPISMDNMDEDSSGDSDLDVVSQDSAFDSRSGSSRYGSLGGHFTLSSAQSSSNMSQSKSTTSVITYQSYLHVNNLLKPGSSLYQGYLNRHGNLILDPTKCRASNPITAVHYFRANKLLRLKYLVEFYRKTSAELTNNLTILQTAMTIFIVVLLLHTFTCIWLLTLIATSPHNIVRTLKLHLIDDDMPMRLWDYTSSFYVVVAVLTSTGGDEFLVDDIPSKIILAICLICGKMLAATVIATSMQVAYSARYALNKYEKATWELIDVLKNQGLSTLIAKTPYVLRCDLMSAMFGQHLRNCFIFAETGEPFLRQLSVLLDYSIYFPGNYIIVAGDSEPRMHWVASGSVAVVSVRPDLTETTHELLGPGDVFGIMQGLNRGVSHCFSYRAENKVGILTLSLDSWINILPYLPDAERIITERSEILFTQI
ncbi:jg15989 [Pararge aegeria aegeria]|uniref:Jg15989 protein n=1 Tax=Pararge aegeria aegeria TaxID=348720 RepID=A0A8S4SPU7_9NEOP|nr:jg15989 [Pararge aegeria aegeria]